MSKLLDIGIKTLDDVGFQFYQTELIHKVLEATGMDHYNGFPTPTKVYTPIGIYENGYETKRYWTNSYDSDIGMMLYLESNTRPYILFAINQCDRFTHNTKASLDMAVKIICRYIQGTKDNGLVFNPSKKLVVDYYADADFAGLWGHKDPQDPICARSRTGFVVTFDNCPLLWVSKI